MGVTQGYMIEDNYDTGYSTAPGFLGIKAQSSLDNRYLTEDVGYTLVLFTELARLAGVPTPTMDAVITIASVLLGRDFAADSPVPCARWVLTGWMRPRCGRSSGLSATAAHLESFTSRAASAGGGGEGGWAACQRAWA